MWGIIVFVVFLVVCSIVHKYMFGSNEKNDSLINNLIVSGIVFVAIMAAYFGLIFVLRILGL